jgi:Cupin
MEPLADVITLLRPRAVGTKVIHGAGRWAVRRSRVAYAGFGLVLAGECWLSVHGHETLRLARGDFVLMPARRGFTIASDLACEVVSLNAQEALACQASEVRYGDPDLEPEFKQLGGYFQLDPVNRSLLGGLLPTIVHIQACDPAAGRLKRTIDSIVEEALADRPGRDLVVDRLIEVLLVEALRFPSESVDAIGRPGLLVGLADPTSLWSRLRARARSAIPSKRILGMEDMELLALGFGVSAAPKLGDCAKAPSLKVEYLSGDPQFR